MLDKYKQEIEACTICHDQCVFACPVFTVERKTTVYPSRKAQIARCLLYSQLPWNAENADLFYRCIACKLCERWCVYLTDRKDPSPIFKEARAEAVERGVQPGYLSAAGARFERYGNFYGDLAEALAGLEKQNQGEKQPGLLFLADSDTLALSPESAGAFIKLLNIWGISPAISPLLDTGFDCMAVGLRRQGLEAAQKLVDFIAAAGIQTIVTSSPKSYYALTEAYRELGLNLGAKVVLDIAYLDEMIRAKEVHFDKIHKAATYQDGIFLARYIKEYDLPRKLIGHIFDTLVEMRTTKEEAKPAAPEEYPLGLDEKTISGITKIRVADIEEVNAAYVITSDPCSYSALKKYYRRDQVLSIPEALWKALHRE